MEGDDVDLSYKRSGRLRSPRQGRTTTPDAAAQLREASARIARLESSGRIRFQSVYDQRVDPDAPDRWLITLVRTELVGTEADVAEYERFQALKKKASAEIPAEKLILGIQRQFHRNGIGYVITPYTKWVPEFLATIASHPCVHGRPVELRDVVVWFLWNFKGKAEITSGRLSSRVRFFTRECAACGRRFRLVADFERAPRGCPKCGAPQYRDLTPTVRGRPLRTITKAGLRRRFRLTVRDLERILSANLVPMKSSG